MKKVQIGWAGFLLLAASGQLQASDHQIAVCLQSSHVASYVTVYRAQLTATRIFAAIHIRIDWRKTLEGVDQEDGVPIQVVFDWDEPQSFYPDALAYVKPRPVTDSVIHVLIDRVRKRGETELVTGVLLGYVIAHEVGHVLEMSGEHSHGSIMKAHLDGRDIEQLLFHPLGFDLIDAERISSGIARRAALCGSEIPHRPPRN